MVMLTGAYADMAALGGFLAIAATAPWSGSPIIWPAIANGMRMAVGFAWVVWQSGWWFATAALGWRKHLDVRQASIDALAKVDRLDATALRESRQSGPRPDPAVHRMLVAPHTACGAVKLRQR